MRQLIVGIIICLMPLVATAQRQSIDVLNAERRAAEIEIARIDEQLRRLEGSKKDASQHLNLVKERLSKRRDVLRSIDAQIAIVDDRAREQSAVATAYTAHLDSMLVCYGRIVDTLYTKSTQLASAGLLLPTARRAAYTHTRHATSIVLGVIAARSSEIRSIQGELGFELRQIAARKEQLALLKEDEAKAVDQINSEKAKIERLTSSIANDEKSLTAEKSRRIKSIAALQKQIEDAIRREVLASKKSSSKGSSPLISEKDPLSIAFVADKGRMISPVAPARIVDTYGLHNHPSERGVKVDNKGVNLSANGGAAVRAVAKGDVRKIFVVAGMGTSILVRHGAYLTVYSNLQSVSVAVGDKVEQGGVIGKIADDGILHFELWRETQTLNPTDWIIF